MIDPNKGKFKKYGLDHVVSHKEKYNNQGKIYIRINDCDITRINGTRESKIIEYSSKIDYYIFNSRFIYEYYTKNILMN